jgi:hypothetical protein
MCSRWAACSSSTCLTQRAPYRNKGDIRKFPRSRCQRQSRFIPMPNVRRRYLELRQVVEVSHEVSWDLVATNGLYGLPGMQT